MGTRVGHHCLKELIDSHLKAIDISLSSSQSHHLGLWVKDRLSSRVIVQVEGLTLAHCSREAQDVFQELAPTRAER